MRIFLSWSGERSRKVATALRGWLPLVVHYADPWLSERDIDAGERWAAEIGTQLEQANFGIICLTKDNLDAPWILFEAGALSKTLQTASVCPYLLDADFKDVSGPLAQFQAKKAERTHTLELLQAINAKASPAVEMGRLAELFDALWPRLEAQLRQIPVESAVSKTTPSQSEVMEELVGVIRGFDHRFRRLEQSIADSQETTARRVTRPSKFVVDVSVSEDIEVKDEQAKARFTLRTNESGIVDELAFLLGLDPAKYDDEWYLLDEKTGVPILRKNLGRHIASGDASVKVAPVPF